MPTWATVVAIAAIWILVGCGESALLPLTALPGYTAALTATARTMESGVALSSAKAELAMDGVDATTFYAYWDEGRSYVEPADLYSTDNLRVAAFSITVGNLVYILYQRHDGAVCRDALCNDVIAVDLRGVRVPEMGPLRGTSILVPEPPIPAGGSFAAVRAPTIQGGCDTALVGADGYIALYGGDAGTDVLETARLVFQQADGSELTLRPFNRTELKPDNANYDVDATLGELASGAFLAAVPSSSTTTTTTSTTTTPFSFPTSDDGDSRGSSSSSSFWEGLLSNLLDAVGITLPDFVGVAEAAIPEVIDAVFGSLRPSDFNVSRPASNATVADVLRVFGAFAVYRPLLPLRAEELAAAAAAAAAASGSTSSTSPSAEMLLELNSSALMSQAKLGAPEKPDQAASAAVGALLVVAVYFMGRAAVSVVRGVLKVVQCECENVPKDIVWGEVLLAFVAGALEVYAFHTSFAAAKEYNGYASTFGLITVTSASRLGGVAFFGMGADGDPKVVETTLIRVETVDVPLSVFVASAVLAACFGFYGVIRGYRDAKAATDAAHAAAVAAAHHDEVLAAVAKLLSDHGVNIGVPPAAVQVVLQGAAPKE